jgi:predicted nucleotide-binding protein
LLGEAGSTKIPPDEDARLNALWEKSDLWPKTAEGATSIWGDRTRTSGFSNSCPEVTFDRFHLFATGLHRYADEIDSDLAHERLGREGVRGANWRWSWASIIPIHFTECPLYSSLTHGDALQKAKTTNQLGTSTLQDHSKVFVVHGHDEGAREGVARFLEKVGLIAIILSEQPNRGRTIIEKFVDCAREVGFAVVLLTPDDLGAAAMDEAQKARARQNVIFELGYFVGSLRRGRACLLRKGEVEIPSDLYGVVYTTMDSGNGWKIELARELKDAGFNFDASKVLA